MNSPEKTLLAGGMLLLIVGLLFGAVYGYLVQHETLLVLRESYGTLLTATAEGNQPAAQAALEQARRMNYAYVRAVDVHTHLIKMASVVLLVGLVYPLVSLSERARRALAVLFLAGAWVFPLGVLAEIFWQGVLPQALAAVGAAAGIAGLCGMVGGLYRGLRPS